MVFPLPLPAAAPLGPEQTLALGAMAAGFASVAGAVYAGYRVFQREIDQARENYRKATGRIIDEMFLDVSVEQLYLIRLSSLLFFAVVGWFVGGVFSLVFCVFLGWGIPKFFIWRYRRQRMLKFDEQLLDGLTSIANSLKSGLSLVQSFEILVQYMNPPISQEFGLMLKEHQMGLTLDEALRKMQDRLRNKNLDLVMAAILIARQVGGNLAETLLKLSEALREIMRLEGKIKAMTAQGRLQGIVISLLPFAFGVAAYFMDPNLIMPLFSHYIGIAILCAIFLCEAIGVFFVRKVVMIEV